MDFLFVLVKSSESRYPLPPLKHGHRVTPSSCPPLTSFLILRKSGRTPQEPSLKHSNLKFVTTKTRVFWFTWMSTTSRTGSRRWRSSNTCPRPNISFINYGSYCNFGRDSSTLIACVDICRPCRYGLTPTASRRDLYPWVVKDPLFVVTDLLHLSPLMWTLSLPSCDSPPVLGGLLTTTPIKKTWKSDHYGPL